MEEAKSRKTNRNIGPLATGSTTIRVSYRDTDQMGVVYYANFFVYYEIARTDLLRQMGRSYRQCEEAGIFLPVLDATCQYKQPALYDDLLELRTTITRWTRAAMDFEYECYRMEDGTLLATGSTRHAFTNREGRVSRNGDKILPLQTEPQNGQE